MPSPTTTIDLHAFVPDTLVACFASAGADELPDRILVFPWGDHTTRVGKFTVNATTAAVLSANNNARRFDTVALDFQHNTLNGGEPKKVAAHGVPEVVEGEGIYLRDLKWTKEGGEHALGGHYPDLSPAFETNERGEVVFVHSVALCRQAELPDLHLFKFSAEEIQPEQENKNTMKLLSIVVELLNAVGASLPADATEDQAIEAFANFKEGDGTVALTAALAAHAANAADTAPPADNLAALTARLEALEARGDDDKRANIIAAATAAGKIVPLSGDDLKGITPAALTALCAKLPAGQVPTSKSGAGDSVDDTEVAVAEGGKINALSAEQKALCDRMGISEDDFADPKKAGI